MAVALTAAAVAGAASAAPGPATAATATAATATAAAGCLAPPRSLTGTPDRTVRLAGGVLVHGWDGVNRRGSAVTLTVADGTLTRLRPVAAVPARLGAAASTTALAGQVRAVVGVNGDFFDYDGAGAAVTPGPQVRAGVAQRVPAGWSPFLGVGADGRLRAQDLRVTGLVTLPPAAPGRAVRRLPVGAVNAAVLPRDRVTVVTSYRNAARPVAGWEVVLRRGLVVWSGRRAGYGPGGRFGGTDLLLAGTGVAGTALRSLRLGQRVPVAYRVLARDGSTVTEAIGRGGVVVTGGRTVARCDGAGTRSRARTLVGWNAAGRVWLLAVDSGGASVPVGGPGLTYYETAELARRLGATEAVLVDGGGSTTLVGVVGRVTRLDAPDRVPQRPVPNGFALVLRP
jgi:hypothetical protein